MNKNACRSQETQLHSHLARNICFLKQKQSEYVVRLLFTFLTWKWTQRLGVFVKRMEKF